MVFLWFFERGPRGTTAVAALTPSHVGFPARLFGDERCHDLIETSSSVFENEQINKCLIVFNVKH
jgi:hypothetical protein